MKRLIVILVLFRFSCLSNAQSEVFNQLSKAYNSKINLPVTVSDLSNQNLINKGDLNSLLFEKQDERAKFYTGNGNLVNVTTYGRIPEDPIKYRTWSDNLHTNRIEKTFETEVFALGHISLDSNYIIWITKVIGFQKTYFDLYVFDQTGKLLSLLNLYEAEYQKIGDPSKFSNVIIKSNISDEGTIRWEENRFNVKTQREYKLQPDGYFKVISQESEGEYEP